MRALTPGKAWGLRRLATDEGFFMMLAVDQRPPIKRLVARARGEQEARPADVAAVKRLLVDELGSHVSAVLLDPHYAYPAAIDRVAPSSGLLLTLEDSVFTETERGRLSASIDNWSVDKIKRIGADAVKVLAWYRPDAGPDVIERQQEFVASVGDACKRFDIPFLLELLVYPFPGDEVPGTAGPGFAGGHTDRVIESVETFTHPRFGVDVFKLESPVPVSAIPDPVDGSERDIAKTRKVFLSLAQATAVPWVMLSAGSTKEEFTRILTYAYEAGASGFLAGRAIWWDEVQPFPDVEACRAALADTSVTYLAMLATITSAHAAQYAGFHGADDVVPDLDMGFRRTYRSMAP